MSGLAMMFFQDRSLLEFQKRMQDRINKNNLKSIFHVQNIPKDTQIRDIIDNTPSDNVEDIFGDFFVSLQRGKQLERFKYIDDHYIVPIDGSGYFSSNNIHCPSCLTLQRNLIF